jgi:hypothetical protein
MLKVATACTAVAVAAILFACGSGGTGTIGSAESTPPVDNGEVTSSAGMKVDATIPAATLGDECPTAAAACAAGTVCRSPCGQSNVQISFTSADGSAPAKIEIVAVTLHDATDGSQVDQLTPSNPQKWDGTGGYVAWDQTIAPKTELKASYTLSAPKWSTMSDQSFSRKFRLQVSLKIDGTLVVLQSEVLSREPPVAT